MTRQECEAEIMRLLRQIVDTYHIYNPDGNYLAMTYLNENNDQYITCSNQYWDNGNDRDTPISCSNYKRGDMA